MERRLLIVFALTFLVIMLFQPLLKKYGPQPPAKPADSQAQNQAPAPSEAPAQLPAQGASTTGTKAAPATAPLQASTESETVIENEVYRIVFTNRGARVKSWVLKKYTDDKGGQLELVNATAAEKYGYPLTLWTYDEGLRDKVNSALYVVTASSQAAANISDATPTLPQSTRKDGAPALSPTIAAPSEIKFLYADGEVSVEKSYTFDRASYVVGVKTAVYQKGAQVTALPMWPAGFGDQITGPQYATSQVAYQYDSHVERPSTSSWTILPSIKVIGGSTIPGPFHWAAVSEQYFAAVFLPQDPQNAAMVTLRGAIEIPHNASDPNNKQQDKVDVFGVAVGSLKGPSDV